MTNNLALNGDDVVILKTMLERHPVKGNLDRVLTGGQFLPSSMITEVNHKRIITKLLGLGLVRENYPKEYLPYFRVGDLCLLLEKYNIKKSIGKVRLIEEAAKRLSDKEITSYKTYKSFYVVSDEGKDILEKNDNVTWFIEQESFIFGFEKNNAVFNTHYFFNHPDVDPIAEMIGYYKTKDSEIVGKLYFLNCDYESAIECAIKLYTSSIVREIKRNIDDDFYLDFLNLTRTVYLKNWIIDSYIQVSNNGNFDLASIVKLNYENNFDFKEIISFDLFEKTIYALIKNERREIDQITDLYKKEIASAYPKDDDSDEEFSNTSYKTFLAQEAAKEVALLDLLMEHLDLEMLEELKKRLELKISEYKSEKIN